MQHVRTRTIYILLTKYSDGLSKTIGLFTGSEYMHASIGLEDRETFFSFNTKKGFCIETPFRKPRSAPRILYRLDVPEDVYDNIAQRIQEFVNGNGRYKFNYLGTVLCILRLPLWCIPVFNNNRYFCSQFVSELLSLSGAAKLRKNPLRYLPKDFSKEPQFRPCALPAVVRI